MHYLFLLLLAQTPTEKLLLEKIAELELRIAALEGKAVAPVVSTAVAPQSRQEPKAPETTVNFYLDGHYGYNFNLPASGANELRAFDVLHNSFTLSQGILVLERAASPSEKRYI